MSAPLAIARQYQDITEVFRARRIELGLSYAYLDAACGFADGHAEAILGPSAKKGWGQSTMFMLCDVLAVEFHAFVNMEAVKRMEVKWEIRRASYVRETVKVSKKLLKLAKPHVLRAQSSLGGLKRHSLLTGKQRIKIAKKAARKSSRLRNLTKEKRHAIAKHAVNTRWDRVRAARQAAIDAALALELASTTLLAPHCECAQLEYQPTSV